MQTDLTAGEKVLVCPLDGSTPSAEAEVISRAGRLLSFQFCTRPSTPLPSGTPVRIESENFLILGETTQSGESVSVQLLIRHALRKDDLQRFREVWLP